MIDVVIVNWNSGVLLANCIQSVRRCSIENIGRIIVVDNGSKDGSCDFLLNMDDVLLIHGGGNLGFGRACNMGAGYARGEYILFLNPDAELYEGVLKVTHEFMFASREGRVGICGVQLMDEAGKVARSCARFPNAFNFLAHSVGVVHYFPRLGHFMNEWMHDRTQPVDHVIGAFFLVRREVFDELDGFDERFFVYLEDLDFSYRARQAGWRSVYLADVKAFHAGGGTSNQVKAKRLFYSLRSRLLYAFKHFSLFGALLVLMSTLLLEPVSRSALAVIRRSWTSLIETWSGYGMLFRWLPQWIFKGVTR